MNLIDKGQEQLAMLDAIYSEYRGYMLRIVKTYIDDKEDCEDVFHNAFLSLIRNKEKVTQLSPPQLKAYILLAVRHASIDYLRKERRMKLADIPDDLLINVLSKSREVLAASETPFRTVEFYSVIEQLPEEDQSILIARYVVGLDSNELAQMLDCKPGAVRVKLHRANKRAFALFSSLGLHLEDFLV